MADSVALSIMPGCEDIADDLMNALRDNDEVVLKEGEYRTSPLAFPSHSRLVLEKGAVLKFIPDFALYPPVFTRWEGVRCWCMHPCIYIDNAEDVTIEGEGTIDGSGSAWWEECLKKKGKDREPESEIELRFASLNPDYKNQPGGGGGREFQFLRPPLIQIKDSRNVKIEGVAVQNSPFWTIHPLFSENIEIRNVRIFNPYEAPNTDGIDIESCSHVSVLDTDVFVGDDGIAIKSGSGEDGIKDNVPAKDILIKGCKVKSAHGGAVIGSETAAEISDITVDSCEFEGTDRGIRIKTRRSRGGLIHDLVFRNITMHSNLCPFVINMYYRCGTNDERLFSLDKQPVDKSTPVIHTITIENCHGYDSKASAGMAVGLPEMPIRNVVIRNSTFAVSSDTTADVDTSDMYQGLPTPPSRGFRLRNIEVKLDNVTIECEGEKIIKEDGTVLI